MSIEFKSIKETEKEAEELGKRSWVTLDLKTAKKDWFKLHERGRTLKEVLKLIDEWDNDMKKRESGDLDKDIEELKQKIEGA